MDKELTAAIVAAAHRRFISWRRTTFAERSERMHRVSEILPEFSGDWLPWSVDRFDPHPNAKAHAALARYAARTILGAEPK